VLSSVLKESIKGYVDSLKQVRRSILGKDMYYINTMLFKSVFYIFFIMETAGSNSLLADFYDKTL
jgi:hypothetical protein